MLWSWCFIYSSLNFLICENHDFIKEKLWVVLIVFFSERPVKLKIIVAFKCLLPVLNLSFDSSSLSISKIWQIIGTTKIVTYHDWSSMVIQTWETEAKGTLWVQECSYLQSKTSLNQNKTKQDHTITISYNIFFRIKVFKQKFDFLSRFFLTWIMYIRFCGSDKLLYPA